MSETNEKNKNIEIITGDPKKAIRKLSIPMMLSMVLIMMYNLADSIWVAGLGPDALAAIGFITPLFMVLIGLGHGIGAGANSLIARNIGAENPAERTLSIQKKTPRQHVRHLDVRRRIVQSF